MRLEKEIGNLSILLKGLREDAYCLPVLKIYGCLVVLQKAATGGFVGILSPYLYRERFRELVYPLDLQFCSGHQFSFL